MAKLTIAIIGCGTLGTCIAKGVLDPGEDNNFSIKRLIATVATENSKQRLEAELSEHSARVSVHLKGDNLKAMQDADVVLFAHKPVKREAVFNASGVKEALHGKLVISIMAGITTSEIRRLVAGAGATNAKRELAQQLDASVRQHPLQIVRAMPNMAAKIREATTLCAADMETLSALNEKIALWTFNQVGQAQFIDESQFDISAVLVGCAGSLLLLAIDGLLDAAVAEGVKRSEAEKITVNSVIGMLKLVPAGEHPSVLREKIASPGGCSIRALLQLEKQAVRSAYTDAILAAAERSKQMSRSS